MSAPGLQWQRAVTQDDQGQPQLEKDHRVEIPKLAPGTVLVKTTAVALNPVDYKMGSVYPRPGAVMGSDFAGTVVRVADGTSNKDKDREAETPSFAVGDHVFGVVPGFDPNNPNNGAFAEYVRAPASSLLRLPRDRGQTHTLTHTEAASLGVALTTCCLALWSPDHLALEGSPDAPLAATASPPPVLVYGGSTATGTMALQLLALSGYAAGLVAVCSPHNFALARSYGAADVFDYQDCSRDDLAAALRARTGGQLRAVLDCISDTHSVAVCLASMARTGGRYASLEHVPDALLAPRRAVRASMVMAAEACGDEVRLSEDGMGPYDRPANTEKRVLVANMFSRVLPRLLDQGRLRPHPIEVLNPEGGESLEAVITGLQKLKTGDVSGRKLVVLV